MSKPDIEPKQSAAGIAVDPKTLERVIPETKRPDGTVRKQLKIRPGFTPQEDIGRFRGSKQQQHDRNQLPKGHILGWVAPSGAQKKPGDSGTGAGAGLGGTAGVGAGGENKPTTKSAAKNAKRKAKKQAEKEKTIRESWEDSDEEKEKEKEKDKTSSGKMKVTPDAAKNQTPEQSETASATDTKSTDETPAPAQTAGDALAEELEKKLDVQ